MKRLAVEEGDRILVKCSHPNLLDLPERDWRSDWKRPKRVSGQKEEVHEAKNPSYTPRTFIALTPSSQPPSSANLLWKDLALERQSRKRGSCSKIPISCLSSFGPFYLSESPSGYSRSLQKRPHIRN